jgi:bacteriochlorophyllide d C-12(1)-methyltransferase
MQTLSSDIVVSSLDQAPDFSEKILQQLAAEQKSRKRWLLIQPISNTSMMVDSVKPDHGCNTCRKAV